MSGNSATIERYLWTLSVMYLCAFSSLFVQIPGLYGGDGILPVKLVLQGEPRSLEDLVTSQPTLLRILPWFGITDPQLGMDLLCFLGIVLSFFAMIFQAFRNALMFSVLWVLYLSLFTVGQTFLWFQWDTLLLEAGFLTMIVAPLGLRGVRSSWFHRHDGITFWLIKWLAFRLMFCSGVVKLLSNCPTWWGLTALNYHYESQCIPTTLAWYFHQLPVWFQKLSVVVTYVIEIPLPFLFFSPVRNQRIFSFLGQAFLMILIILTGNYNFFNWITIALCLSIVDDDFLLLSRWTAKQPGEDEKFKRPTVISRLCSIIKFLINLAVYGVILFGTIRYFSIRFSLRRFSIKSSIAFSMDDLKEFMQASVPLSIWIGLICLGKEIISSLLLSLFGEKGVVKKLTNATGIVFFGLVAVWMFCLSLVPYTDVERVTQERLPASFNRWFRSTAPLQLTHSYGLFRSMTGVGGRPEVIIEGSEYTDREWKEYNFLFKPGDVGRKLPLVAPHQPRLDWQMWFAALGSYNYNPWFLNLVYRLLMNQTEVLQLIDKSPFDTTPPNYIRAQLYHYHYTSYNSSSRDWWKREHIREYLPIVWKTEPSFVKYLKSVNIYKNPDEHQKVAAKELSDFEEFFVTLHSIFPPSEGFNFCAALFVTGVVLLFIKGAIFCC